jgi:foldase protein PrsA
MQKSRLFIALAMLLLVGACSKAPAPAVDKTIVEINGDGISENQYNKMVKFRTVLYEAQNGVKLDPNKDAVVLQSFKDAAFEQLVNDTIITQETNKRGITVDEKAVDSDLEQMKQEITLENYKNMLASTGLTEGDIRAMAQTQILVQKFYESIGQVNDDEVKNFYEDHKSELKQSIEISHILVKTETEANQVLDQLNSGQDFKQLAAKYSIDPGSKDQGGYLQAANILTNWVPEFKAAALKLKPGDISPQPIKSIYGFHIIKAGNIIPVDKAGYSDLEFQIKECLQIQKISDVVENLKKQAVINDLRQK